MVNSRTYEKFPFMKSGSKSLDEDFLEEVHDKGLELMDDKKTLIKDLSKENDQIIIAFGGNGGSGFEVSPDDQEDFVDWFEDAIWHEFDILTELGKNEEALSHIDFLLGFDPNDIAKRLYSYWGKGMTT